MNDKTPENKIPANLTSGVLKEAVGNATATLMLEKIFWRASMVKNARSFCRGGHTEVQLPCNLWGTRLECEVQLLCIHLRWPTSCGRVSVASRH